MANKGDLMRRVILKVDGFGDIKLKQGIMRGIQDSDLIHPSEVQQKCIPLAVKGMDILCQAESGSGKTTVFVLATLQQLETTPDNHVKALVMCHTRELALQISEEYERFAKYMPHIKVGLFTGGLPIKMDIVVLENNCPHIVVGTPGRILALIQAKALNLKNLRHFILDECDKMLGPLDMRSDVSKIFRTTPHWVQVMMFGTTLSKGIKRTCKMFMKSAIELYVDDEAKLIPPGIKHFYDKLNENEKNRMLVRLLRMLQTNNKVVIFVKSAERSEVLSWVLHEQHFPNVAIHGEMCQEERLETVTWFKDFDIDILVATDLFGRGMSIGQIDTVINYDMPGDPDTYLHRVARAGRFGTKGRAITFVSDENDAKILSKVTDRFGVKLNDLGLRN